MTSEHFSPSFPLIVTKNMLITALIRGYNVSRSKMGILEGSCDPHCNKKSKDICCCCCCFLFLFLFLFLSQTYFFLCLSIHSKNLLPQTRWKLDVPRFFFLSNTNSVIFSCFSCFFRVFFLQIWRISHGNWWCLFWLIWIEGTTTYT